VKAQLGTKRAQIAYIVVTVTVTVILQFTVSTTAAWGWLAATVVAIVALAGARLESGLPSCPLTVQQPRG
jgi:hypothetical protein